MCSLARKMGAGGQFVAAHAFEDRRAVVDDVRHDVDGRVVPVDELAVVPDLVGLLDCHADSLRITDHYIRASCGDRLLWGQPPSAVRRPGGYRAALGRGNVPAGT